MSDLKKIYVYLVEPNKILLFNILAAFLGYSYAGKEDSSTYTIIMIVAFLLSFLIYLKEVVMKRTIRKKGFLFVLCWIIWILTNIILFINKYGLDYAYVKYFIFFFVFSFNSLLWGMEFGRNFKENASQLIKWYEPFVFIVAIYSIVYVLIPFLNANYLLRGSAYQSNSYYSAFAFGCILFYLLFGNRFTRFKIFENKVCKIFYLVLLMVLPLSVISTGGRGGFVLVLLYGVISILYMVFGDHEFNIKKLVLAFLTLVGFFVLILILVSVISKNTSLRESFSYTVSYLDFSTGKIDMGATSNRDLVYKQAIDLIMQSPIFGHGIFLSMPLLTTTYSYPHQLFLEFMLQGGAIYTFVASAFLITALIKLKRFSHVTETNRFMVYLFLYPFVMLMFSGTYLTTSLFWFCLSAILMMRYSYEDI